MMIKNEVKIDERGEKAGEVNDGSKGHFRSETESRRPEEEGVPPGVFLRLLCL